MREFMPEMSRKDVPYWNVNVPREEWTEECPDYLADVDQNDRKHLSVWDEDYHVQSWAEVQDVIRKTTPARSCVHARSCCHAGDNRLEQFKRLPSQLHAYRKHMGQLKAEYGSVMNFILKYRVQWDDLTARGQPFQYKGAFATMPQLRLLPGLWFKRTCPDDLQTI